MSNERRGGAWRRLWPDGIEFVVGAVPAVAFAYVTVLGDVRALTQFHIWAGTVWTLCVLARGFGVAPLLDGRDAAGVVAVLSRVVPLSVVSLPVLTVVTIGAGLELAVTHRLLSDAGLLIQTVLAVSALVALIALGIVFPTDARVYRELRADDTDHERVARLGTRNARFLTAQGTLQVMMLFLMYQVSGQLV